ncbi:MAG TPA: methylenetetrahydrofolate reductase, partial [Dehalococcoidales bacterium]|nr:methylenetetrahydrofolate reductase [Dehalococcoidales bacterium]
MSLQPLFEKGKFVITAEVGPLKGTDTTELMEAVEVLKGKVDAANVTDQQSSVMRLGSLSVCHLLKMKGLEPVFQVTCRDRNRVALQSDLLSAAVLGIENVLSITGDLPVLGDHPEAKPVYDLDSVQLLWVMNKLNEGFDMQGNELKGKPSFFPGAVVNPGADTEAARELQLIKMEKKIKAGARFFQ